MKACNCCGEEKPLCAYPKDRNGHKKTCKACYSGRQAVRNEFARNRKFNALIRAAFALVLVTGVYSHDYIKGRTRTCIYDSMYGSHAITIDAMQMCPLTWEFDV